ncbi:MAG: hypothetical protein ABIO70_24160 [Pseudomonadota bacterium]
MPLIARMLLLATLLRALLPAPCRAQEGLPPELEPWAGWVLHGHPELSCPVTSAGASCVWPGALELDLGAEGGSFALEVRVDRDMAVPLPGGAARWPQDVRVDGQAAPVLDAGGVPMLRLAAGAHRVAGRFAWSTLPQGLPLSPATGRIALTVDGVAVPQPAVDEAGMLRLGPGAGLTAAEERLDLEVCRQVQDGVPVRVDTHITLRASGSAREVALGKVALPGTRPLSLTADLPARFSADGELVVQVRAGTFTVDLEALHEGPVERLAAPTLPAPWPAQEYWAVRTDDRVRAVELSGPPAVDPARTPLPEAWRGLATFLVSPDQPLAFGELRRGEPEPAPNRLTLAREIWLDADGGGYTFRDRFSGSMRQGWRLAMLQPYELGHGADHAVDQVITRGEEGGAGLELRQGDVAVVAESRIEGFGMTLPAVGWSTDVASLSATLHLAPGWSLVAAGGVDRVPGSLLYDWDLFDLFFVLILALATGRLLGWRWGAVALLGLALSRQELDAPAWSWAFLLICVGLARWVPEGWARHVARGLLWTFAAILLLILVPFSVHQARVGLFPVLEHPWSSSVPDEGVFSGAPTPMDQTVSSGEDLWGGVEQNARGEGARAQHKAPEGKLGGRGAGLLYLSGSSDFDDGGLTRAPAKGEYLSLQYDPSSVANTGPGVQQWNWNPDSADSWDYNPRGTWGTDPVLEWSGPVTAEQSMWLFLLGPRANAAVNLLEVALLLALALRMAGLTSLRLPPRQALPAVAVLALGLAVPSAQAAPAPELLQELEARLTAPSDCAPDCVAAPRLSFAVEPRSGGGEVLVMVAEVHVAALSSWPVPGPAQAWVPASVAVDGLPTSALARLSDGFLHVRLAPGVHRLEVRGPLPVADSLTLTLGLQPKRAAWAGSTGWSLDGLHDDGTAERTVQLTRTLPSSATEAAAQELTPWLTVRRFLDLGIPWRVRTEVERVGGSDAPLSLLVPVLEGEAVTDETLQVQDGRVRVSLDRNRSLVSWVSTLEVREGLALTAPEGVAWTESWVLSCSPVFRCEHSGLVPLSHSEGGVWAPTWLPWPGEQVSIAVSRPEAVPGQTVTIDQARLDWTPGRRLGEGSLGLVLRTSQGGQQAITLPAGARLQQVLIDGTERPLQLRDHKVWLPLRPGAQAVRLTWQQEQKPGLISRVPAVDLGSPAVNVGVVMHAPQERCVLGVIGPAWGPVPLFWTYVLVVLVAAPLLARLPWTTLRAWQWALLGLGMTQVPIICPALVVGWFVLVGFRARRAPKSWWAFDLTQLGLVLATMIALGCLYAAIHAGLLLQPEMQIQGNGSSDTELMWFADRVAGALPTPAVISIPMGAWRVTMLLWALWAAASLLSWLPETWRAFRKDRWFMMPPTPPRPARRGPGAPPAPAADEAPAAPEVPPVPPASDQLEESPTTIASTADFEELARAQRLPEDPTEAP